MIFKTFDETDIVAGRTTKVASGFWPDGSTTTLQSEFVDDFNSLVVNPASDTPSYGTSPCDVRKTMYYLNVFPSQTQKDINDSYFSIAYGHFYGNIGSGSFLTETTDIMTSPTKIIYTQYQNMLLGTADLDGKFSMKSGSTTTNADDIWVISFSSYKMKDRIDEGNIELSFKTITPVPSRHPDGFVTLIDDSYYTSQAQSSYQIISGSLDLQPSPPVYSGLGLFYPQNGVIILNAKLLAIELGLWNEALVGSENSAYLTSPDTIPTTQYNYNPGLTAENYTYNHKTLFESMRLAVGKSMQVRKSEYVPARHYFVRVKNRDFNYSNNPTYVYDGTDGIHAKGTIRNTDFVTDPKTYITTIGLYNDNNELVAIAKLSRPAVKTFDNELLVKVRLDF
jgi:hypothetical protein